MNNNSQRFAGGPVPQNRTRAWVMLTVSVLFLAFLIWAIAVGGADGGVATVAQFAVAFAVVALLGWRGLVGLRHTR